MSVRLFHFSEDPSIRAFTPHVPEHRPEVAPQVWAIDEWHAPMYYFPRQCPRACFWPGPQTSEDDRRLWFGTTDARMVICIEWVWLDRVRAAELYRYEMPPATFIAQGDDSGHWVSAAAVEPLSVEPVGDLLIALAEANVELRVMPRLADVWRRVVLESTLSFSGTRLRNAQGHEEFEAIGREWEARRVNART